MVDTLEASIEYDLPPDASNRPPGLSVLIDEPPICHAPHLTDTEMNTVSRPKVGVSHQTLVSERKVAGSIAPT